MSGTSDPPPWLSLPFALALVLFIAATGARSEPWGAGRLDGVNVIVTPGHPFGSATARTSLARAKQLGARAIAVVPFLWQSTPSSADLVRGADMSDDELRAGIRQAHALGLSVLVKPHVWVPQSWAGAVAMKSSKDWQEWFANYGRELDRIARVAAADQAEALAIGTELKSTTQNPQWRELIGATRSIYRGRLIYMAHNVEEAEAVTFWDALDAIGVTLYPPFGADDDRDGRRSIMRAVAERLDALQERSAKPIVVGEIGLRSAEGAAARPWESAEERTSAPDPALQAAVIEDWLAVLDRPTVSGVLIWRWFTDPDAGGPADTDFTVQHKPAERVLACVWAHLCAKGQARAPFP